jgi:hypothetical protein
MTLGLDPTEATAVTSFIGDSENDAACFAAFRTTLAVRNLRGRPTVAPRFVTLAEKGQGFAEAAALVCALRASAETAAPKAGNPGPVPDRASPRGMVREPVMNASQGELVESAARTLYPNYRQPPLVLERGKGTEVWDVSGKRYLDLAAGIAVSSLGHAHPALVSAIAEQAGKLIHVSNYFYNRTNVELAARLTRMAKMDKVFFCNSGTEALEASLKLVRRHFYAKGQTERFRVIAFEQSFHGRTLGALAATGQKSYREASVRWAESLTCHTGTSRRCARRWVRTSAPCWWSPCKERAAFCPPPQGSSRSSEASRGTQARSWSRTKCRRGSVARDASSASSTRGLRRTSSRSPRGSAAAFPSARCS